MSGVRPAVTQRHAMGAGSESHAEMLRAVERGDCLLLVERRSEDGTTAQWSAWFVGTEVVFQAWLQQQSGAWSKGPSFSIDKEVASRLAALVVERVGPKTE